MGLCSRCPIRVPLLTKRHRQLCLQWAQEHRDWTMDDWKIVAWSDESQLLIHCLPGEQLLPSCTAGHNTGWWGGGGWYYALGDVLMGGSETHSCGRTDHESCELSEYHCGSVATLHGICLLNWKWNLPSGQRPMLQGSDCVGVVRGAY
ncbi:hypothetical protein AVEN_69587-1 [Araneus ventricosus]|uniref:Transposase Tc1-like domain-containing protein n=1 Tax=Araneus ventricosus TaxID=182803 RepID=A0A4Y2TRV1_ARAVE|nr:hypothetical protein AVEN_69587-1 [Araneus ventricosus]